MISQPEFIAEDARARQRGRERETETETERRDDSENLSSYL